MQFALVATKDIVNQDCAIDLSDFVCLIFDIGYANYSS